MSLSRRIDTSAGPVLGCVRLLTGIAAAKTAIAVYAPGRYPAVIAYPAAEHALIPVAQTTVILWGSSFRRTSHRVVATDVVGSSAEAAICIIAAARAVMATPIGRIVVRPLIIIIARIVIPIIYIVYHGVVIISQRTIEISDK